MSSDGSAVKVGLAAPEGWDGELGARELDGTIVVFLLEA